MWDDLGIPHEEAKQLPGVSLPIIGFECNVDAMMVSMPPGSLVKFDQALDVFCSHKHPLWTIKDCQRLTGHVNWALNVAPCLCPGLASLYAKMYCPVSIRAPKRRGVIDQHIHITEDVHRDLCWMQQLFRESTGIHLLSS